MKTNIIYPISAALCSLCVIILLIYWYLVPKWRNLQNYIAIQQIVTGTLQLYCSSALILTRWDMESEYWMEIVYFNSYVFLLSLCWSLCNSLVAYLKLVLVCSGSKSYEKRIASAFSYGTFFVICGVCYFTQSRTRIQVLICLDESKLYIFVLHLMPMYLIITINLAMFVRVLLAVNAVTVRSSKAKRRVTLLGVGLFCDVITGVYMIVTLLYYSVVIYRDHASEPGEPDHSFKVTVIVVTQFVFAFRLIPQCIAVLFNKSSREHWKQFLRERRRKLNANQ